MGNRWGNSGNSGWLYFLGLQNHCRWWLQPWNWKTLTPWKEIMTNVYSLLKSRDFSLPTNVRLVKAMVFPVVMYGYKNWTVKKAEHQRIDAFALWYWRRLLRVLWTARRSSIHPKGNKCWIFIGRTMLKLRLQFFGHLLWRNDPFEKTLMLGKIEGARRSGWQDEMVGWHHHLNGNDFE